MLMDVVRTAHPIIKVITSIRTIVLLFSKPSNHVGMLGEVEKLVAIYLTFPVTSATAECLFSSL